MNKPSKTCAQHITELIDGILELYESDCPPIDIATYLLSKNYKLTDLIGAVLQLKRENIALTAKLNQKQKGKKHHAEGN